MDTTMSVLDFGRALVETGDLDPVYILLWEAKLEPEVLRRYLIAYSCFYHVGTASWIVDVRGKDEGAYWSRMERAAGSKDWPRSSERRHFRGENARKSVTYLKRRGVAALFQDLRSCGASARQAVEVVKQWVGFGPWIAFKAADLLERLGIQHLEFDESVAMYDSPRKGVELVWDKYHGPEESSPGQRLDWVLGYLIQGLGRLKAPPGRDRQLGLQEYETVLCKWHSHLNGHYHVGKDIAEVRHGLLRFARCKIAQRLYAGGRKGGLWK